MTAPERYDDLYYDTTDGSWEVMLMWDNDFKQYATLVHPKHGTVVIRDPEIVEKLSVGNFEGLSLDD